MPTVPGGFLGGACGQVDPGWEQSAGLCCYSTCDRKDLQ